MKPKQNQPNATADTSARGRRLSRGSGSGTRKSSATSRGSSTATRGSPRSELKGLQNVWFFTPGTGRQSRTSTGRTVQRTTSASPAAKESSRMVKTSTSKNQPGPSTNVAVTKGKLPTGDKPVPEVHKLASIEPLPQEHSTSQRQPAAFKSAAQIEGHQPTVATPLAKPVPQAHKPATTEPLSKYNSTVVPHDPSAIQGQSIPSNDVAVTQGQQPKCSAASARQQDAEVQRPGGSGSQAQPSSKQRADVKPVSFYSSSAQQSTVAKPLADFTETVSAPPGNTGSAELLSPLARSAPKPLAGLTFGAAKATEPLSICTSTVVPQDLASSQATTYFNRPEPPKSVAVTKGQQSKCNAASVQQHEAEVQRPGGSGMQAQSASKKRPQVQVVAVEHVAAAAMPLGDDMDRLAQDILKTGSKKSKMAESDKDRRIRLFHLARAAHNQNPDADRRIRCEKLVEFIVDDSFIGAEPRDRRELLERLLDMCLYGVFYEDIDCDNPRKKLVLKSYSHRAQAWGIICDRFPALMSEFKAQSNGASPCDVLTDDAFKKINKYLGELKAALHSIQTMLKEAVVWELLGSAGHRYEECSDEIRKSVAELIGNKIP